MSCKICSNDTQAFGSADFNQNCNQGYDIPPSGEMVDYHQCLTCEFIATTHFDSYSPDEFQAKIYNEDYIKVDPLYPVIRPKANAAFFREVLDNACPNAANPAVLDYGAGNGRFSEFLADRLPVTNYDPFNPQFDKLPDEQFDIVFSSEVLEHMPFPAVFCDHVDRLLKPDGVALFSTMLQPPDIDSLRTSWWYIGPRNGHVSIFSRKSLSALFAERNMVHTALSDEWHLASRKDSAPAIDMKALQSIVSRLPTGFIPV